MPKTRESKHVVLGVPSNVGDQIEEAALIPTGDFSPICLTCGNVPEMRRTIFRPSYQILAIRRNAGSYHQVSAFGAKESLPYAGAFHRLVLKEADAIISGVHEQLVFVLRVDYELINLVALQLLLADREEIVCVDISLSYINVPDGYMASGVTYKESSVGVKDHTVRMHVVKDTC